MSIRNLENLKKESKIIEEKNNLIVEKTKEIEKLKGEIQVAKELVENLINTQKKEEYKTQYHREISHGIKIILKENSNKDRPIMIPDITRLYKNKINQKLSPNTVKIVLETMCIRKEIIRVNPEKNRWKKYILMKY